MHTQRVNPDEMRTLLNDAPSIQAGAWLASFFHQQPDAELTLPLRRDLPQDLTTDVPVPSWPLAADGDDTRRTLQQFVRAGLLEETGPQRYRPVQAHKRLLDAFPLYHVRTLDDLPRKFPELPERVRGKRVMDAGCGLGPFTLLLDAMEPESVPAVDYLPAHLDLARELTTYGGGRRIRFLRGSIEGLPLEDASLDFIFCRVVLPLVHNGRTMTEFARVLAPGGYMLLAMHDPRYYIHRIANNLRARQPRNVLTSVLGLLGGLSFDWFGHEPRWKGRFHLNYQRPGSFGRLLERLGLETLSWERGVPKPYVWVRKR